MNARAPTLTPPTIIAGKQQTVVVEFERDFPKSVLVTFDFYDEKLSKKIGTVPTNPLGTRAVKANFPEFTQPGTVNVGVQLARADSPLFPKFRIRVQSQLEALLSVAPLHLPPPTSPPSGTALLASIVAFLTNCQEKDKEESEVDVDGALANVLRSTLPHMQQWNLSHFLCGRYGQEENLLHLCVRHKFNKAALELLNCRQPILHYLNQQSADSKTPLEIAKKNNMKKVAQTMERLQAEFKKLGSKGGVAHTPDAKKRKKQAMKRAKSIEQDLSVVAANGAVEYGPLPLYAPTTKKKGGRFWKTVFRGDKIQISAPQQPQLDDDVFTNSPQHHTAAAAAAAAASELTHSLPASGQFSTASRGTSEGTITPQSSPYATPRPDQHQQLSSHGKQTIGFTIGDTPKRDATQPPRQTLSPTDFTSPDLSTSPTSKIRCGSLVDGSSEGSTHSLEQKKSRPPSSISSGYDSAVSNAIEDLKNKRLYTAVVTRDYNWASAPNAEFIIKEGATVYVTRDEPESQAILGVCNKHYGKFPRQILRKLTPHEADQLEEYEAIDDFEEADDSPYVYHPRNIPRLDSGSESDPQEQDEVKDKLLETLQAEGYYMRVPKTARPLQEEYLSSIMQDTELSREELQDIMARAQAEKRLSLEKHKVPPPRLLRGPKPPTRSASMDKMSVSPAPLPPSSSSGSKFTPSKAGGGAKDKNFEVVSTNNSEGSSQPRQVTVYDEVVRKRPQHMRQPIRSEPLPKPSPSHSRKQTAISRGESTDGKGMAKTQEGENASKTTRHKQKDEAPSSTPQTSSIKQIKDQLQAAGLKPQPPGAQNEEESGDEVDLVYDTPENFISAVNSTEIKGPSSYDPEEPEQNVEIEEIYDNLENCGTAPEHTEHRPYVNFVCLEDPPPPPPPALSAPNDKDTAPHIKTPTTSCPEKGSTVSEPGPAAPSSKPAPTQNGTQGSPERLSRKTSFPPSPPKRETPFNPKIPAQNAATIAAVQSTATNVKLPSTQSMLERATALAERGAANDSNKSKSQRVSPVTDGSSTATQSDVQPHLSGPVPAPRKRVGPSAPAVRSHSIDTASNGDSNHYHSQTFPRRVHNELQFISSQNGISAKNHPLPPTPAPAPAPVENSIEAAATNPYVNLEVLTEPPSFLSSQRSPSRNRSQTVKALRSPQHSHSPKGSHVPPPVAPRPSPGVAKKPSPRHQSSS